MAIVESQGTSYVVGVGEKVGDATVVAISEDSVVLREAGSTRTVAVAGGRSSLRPPAQAAPTAVSPVVHPNSPPSPRGEAACRRPSPRCRAAAAPPNPGAGAADPPQSYRVAIGPFYKRAHADAIAERLIRAGFAPTVIVDGQDKREGYRVVSPPLPIQTAEHRIKTRGRKNYQAVPSYLRVSKDFGSA